MNPIRYVRVDSRKTESGNFETGFVAAYKEAFGGPPYNEVYTDEQVIGEVWNPHLERGIVVLALDADVVVGFGCAKPIRLAPQDVQDFLAERQRAGVFPVNLHNLWYMSEIGVLNRYRGQGIGLQLVRHRLIWINERGMTHKLDGGNFVMRTAVRDSNSVRIYSSIGAKQLPGLQDVSDSDQVLVNKSQSNERVYLFGSCDLALWKIAEISR